MSEASLLRAFRIGLRDGAPFLLIVAPFGLLFGAVATEAGLAVGQAVAMSVLIVSGASQFTAVQLIGENAPGFIVLLASLTVALRMAMYSAYMAPRIGSAPLWQRALVAYILIDQVYAASVSRQALTPSFSRDQVVAHMVGAGVLTIPPFFAATWIGATVGAAVPDAWALDFALPITFIAMVAPMLRSLPQVIAAAVSVAAALAFAWLPLNLGLIVAALIAMTAGAVAETRLGTPGP